MNVVSLWLAVDGSTPSNGAMQVVRGSHRGKLRALVDDRTLRNISIDTMLSFFFFFRMAQNLDLRWGLLSDPSTFGALGPNQKASPYAQGCDLS